MCGLVGYAGSLNHRRLSAFRDLLVVDTLRGQDSTGVGVINRDRKIAHNIKHIMNGGEFASIFMPKDTYSSVRPLSGLSHLALIGHNRHATIGKVTKVNAHPFTAEGESIIGAHNGTIPDASFRNVEINRHKYGTDSEALINSLEQNGTEETFEKLQGGAYAVSWYDQTVHNLNFLRNDERPLFFAEAPDNRGLFWASEAPMLAWILERNELLQEFPKIEELPVGVWRSWTLKPEVASQPVLVQEKDAVLDLKKLTTPVAKTGPRTRVTPSNSSGSPTNRRRTISLAEERKKRQGILDLHVTDDGEVVHSKAINRHGQKMSQSQAKKFLRSVSGDTQGADCIFCSSTVRKEDEFVALEGGPLCGDCKNNSDVCDMLESQGLTVNWS